MSVSTLCLQGPLFATTSENRYTDSVPHMCKLSTNWLPFKLCSMKFQENKESTPGWSEMQKSGGKTTEEEMQKSSETGEHWLWNIIRLNRENYGSHLLKDNIHAHISASSKRV